MRRLPEEFRREPEMSDRQQNIRIAMDIIAKDVESAGGGAPLVAQVFTHTDDPLGGPAATGVGAPYLNGAGPQGVMGAPGQALRGRDERRLVGARHAATGADRLAGRAGLGGGGIEGLTI